MLTSATASAGASSAKSNWQENSPRRSRQAYRALRFDARPLENGKLVPTPATLVRISMAFDLGLEHLFGDRRGQ